MAKRCSVLRYTTLTPGVKQATITFMSKNLEHPGAYVRQHVIPKDVNVTQAARLLEIGRPALSNFLNGKADLSPEMAARLEISFNVSARELLDMQSAWDAARPKRESLTPILKSYVPPFLQIKATKIEEWAGSTITARQRFPVLLRTLVNSTGAGLTKVNFPGNDDSERPGWDGEIQAEEATPWIPQGHSGWEFGVNQDAKTKADSDYAKSVAALDAADRKNMTFVFVTPRTWRGKDGWVDERKAEGHWKDVRAYDASDLEQWIEQSIVGQVWFANETGQDARGAISLDEVWKRWGADCEPALLPSMFDDALASYRITLQRAISGDNQKPIIISADSRDEALAFLSAGFNTSDADLAPYRDRIIVFQEVGALSKLAAQVSNFIPVILSREVEKEFAPYRTVMPSFIVYPRNATASDPDIALETLNFEGFQKALDQMGLGHDRIQQLNRETGRSPTVIRRRLSRFDAIRTPDWSSNRSLATMLVPFLLAGTWKADNSADRAMLEALAGDVDFDELERRMSELLPLDSSPVWWVGSFRGVVSKIDVLFAIKDVFLETDLKRFYEVAELVLGEDDPALELPEDKQWAAGIYGKTREISAALRDGIAESLVLLSVYGSTLFKPRLSFNSAGQAERLVRKLLEPLTLKALESQSSDLPLYAEAAPEPFLSIIENDLDTPEPASLALMKPMSSAMFGRSHRTGLLWALENLSWSEHLFMRTVLVLGRLSERVIEDNLMNKPIASLSSIFRSWMPQASVDLESRKKAISNLSEKFPTVTWPLLVEQFSTGSRTGHYSHKPRWRPDGHGRGNPVQGHERNEFALFAFELALAWPKHSRETIGDLVANLDGIDESFTSRVWDVVDQWIEDADEPDRTWLREKIRVSAFSRRAVKRRKRRGAPTSNDRARAAYEKLEPRDPVLRHEWLFRQSWVDESWEEITDDDYDFRKRDERISQQRTAAVETVLNEGGIEAVVRLAEMGQAHHTVGWFLSKAIGDPEALKAALLEVVGGEPLSGVRFNLVGGGLGEARNRDLDMVRLLSADQSVDLALSILLAAPFDQLTWDVVQSFADDLADRYWQEIDPGWNRTADDVRFAVNRLVEAGRPRAAFQFAHFELKELPSKDLFNLLDAIARRSNEPANTYLLDPYHLREAFELLNASGQMSTDDMAGLEFTFIDIFDDDHGIDLVNLGRQIEAHPELYVQAVGYSYRRDDEGEDMPEPELTEEQISNRASSCYKLLDKLRAIPGHDENGELDAERIIKWVEQVRAGCADIARSMMGDQSMGHLLAHAPAADDDVWPCMPVRDALEQVTNEELERGLHVALRNSRGAHWRGEGGAQERGIAAKYAGWAKAMEYTHPRVAAILRGMEDAYLREAEWEDSDAKITRRMRY